MKTISAANEVLRQKNGLSMRTLFGLSVIMFLLTTNYARAQEVIELPYVPLDSSFINLAHTLKQVDEEESNKYFELCINALDELDNPESRYNLIFWELSFKYVQLNQYDKCFEILKKGHDEGLYYFFKEGDIDFRCDQLLPQ
jgi:hypothetical protein